MFVWKNVRINTNSIQSYAEKYNSAKERFWEASHIEGSTDNVIGITVHCGSMGSDWRHEPIIYVVNQLLDLGVKSENIYCFIMVVTMKIRVCFPIMNYMNIDSTVLQPTSYPAGDMLHLSTKQNPKIILLLLIIENQNYLKIYPMN